MNTTTRINGLEQEIGRLKSQLQKANTWRDDVKSLSDFTPKIKCSSFDQLYNHAVEYVQEVIETGRSPKDGKQWIYEAVMEVCLGIQVWSIIDSSV